NKLGEEGVKTNLIKKDQNYSTALIFASAFPPNDSEVLQYVYPNAHSQINIDDVNSIYWKKGDVLVVAGTALSTSPSRDATLYALRENKSAGGCNIMDIDLRRVFWESEENAQLYYDIGLQYTDIILANE